MKIAVVAPSLRTLGGQSVQADELIRVLRRAGHQATLIPINPQLPKPLQWLSRIKLVKTVVNQIAYGFLLLRIIPKVDVVHIFSASYFSFLLAPVPAMIVSRLLGKRTILNYHSGEADDHLQRWRWLVKPLLKLSHRVVVPSTYLAHIFKRHGLQAQVISNIIDLDRFSYHERFPLQPRFISTRNFESIYDVANTLYVFEKVQRVFPDATLNLIGSGSQLDALKTLADSLHLKGVRFSGSVVRDEIPRHYAEAHIFLNSSRVDNQPVSIIEAFACGLPVVTTDPGGISYMVEDGVTGLLVKPGSPDQMAQKIIELLESPTLGLELTRNARRECRQFRWDTITSSLITAYQGIEYKAPDQVAANG